MYRLLRWCQYLQKSPETRIARPLQRGPTLHAIRPVIATLSFSFFQSIHCFPRLGCKVFGSRRRRRLGWRMNSLQNGTSLSLVLLFAALLTGSWLLTFLPDLHSSSTNRSYNHCSRNIRSGRLLFSLFTAGAPISLYYSILNTGISGNFMSWSFLGPLGRLFRQQHLQ